MQHEPSDNLVNRTFSAPLLMVFGFLLLHDFAILLAAQFDPFDASEASNATLMFVSISRLMWTAILGVIVLMRIQLFYPSGLLKWPSQWEAKASLYVFLGAAFIAQVGFGAFWFGLGQYGSTIAALSLVADFGIGLTEEVWFRGVVFLILLRAWGHERRQVLQAILVSSALFGIWHMGNVLQGQDFWVTFLQVFYTGFLGIIFAVLLLISGSLWVPIIAHGFFDIGVHLSSLSFGSAAITGGETRALSFAEAFAQTGSFVVLSAVLAFFSLRYLSSQEPSFRERFGFN